MLQRMLPGTCVHAAVMGDAGARLLCRSHVQATVLVVEMAMRAANMRVVSHAHTWWWGYPHSPHVTPSTTMRPAPRPSTNVQHAPHQRHRSCFRSSGGQEWLQPPLRPLTRCLPCRPRSPLRSVTASRLILWGQEHKKDILCNSDSEPSHVLNTPAVCANHNPLPLAHRARGTSAQCCPREYAAHPEGPSANRHPEGSFFDKLEAKLAVGEGAVAM